MDPHFIISDKFWFFNSNCKAWDISIIKLIDKRGSDFFYDHLILWGLIGVMDLSIPREHRVLIPVSKDSVIQWARTQGKYLLKSVQKAEALRQLIESENLWIDEQHKMKLVQLSEKEKIDSDLKLAKLRKFEESVAKLPHSKDQNLNIIRQIVGLPDKGDGN